MAMPLSEHEQKLLEQLEKQLNADHEFTSSFESATSPGGFSPRSLVIGAIGAVVGIVVLLLGINQQLIIVGVLGFLLMCGSMYFALSRGTKSAAGSSKPATSKAKGNRQGSFMQNLEKKWEERGRDI
ncbi:hypothetical protein GCM10009861_12270 [Neomicrococcus aestuarii]